MEPLLSDAEAVDLLFRWACAQLPAAPGVGLGSFRSVFKELQPCPLSSAELDLVFIPLSKTTPTQLLDRGAFTMALKRVAARRRDGGAKTLRGLLDTLREQSSALREPMQELRGAEAASAEARSEAYRLKQEAQEAARRRYEAVKDQFVVDSAAPETVIVAAELVRFGGMLASADPRDGLKIVRAAAASIVFRAGVDVVDGVRVALSSMAFFALVKHEHLTGWRGQRDQSVLLHAAQGWAPLAARLALWGSAREQLERDLRGTDLADAFSRLARQQVECDPLPASADALAVLTAINAERAAPVQLDGDFSSYLQQDMDSSSHSPLSNVSRFVSAEKSNRHCFVGAGLDDVEQTLVWGFSSPADVFVPSKNTHHHLGLDVRRPGREAAGLRGPDDATHVSIALSRGYVVVRFAVRGIGPGPGVALFSVAGGDPVRFHGWLPALCYLAAATDDSDANWAAIEALRRGDGDLPLEASGCMFNAETVCCFPDDFAMRVVDEAAARLGRPAAALDAVTCLRLSLASSPQNRDRVAEAILGRHGMLEALRAAWKRSWGDPDQAKLKIAITRLFGALLPRNGEHRDALTTHLLDEFGLFRSTCVDLGAHLHPLLTLLLDGGPAFSAALMALAGLLPANPEMARRCLDGTGDEDVRRAVKAICRPLSRRPDPDTLPLALNAMIVLVALCPAVEAHVPAALRRLVKPLAVLTELALRIGAEQRLFDAVRAVLTAPEEGLRAQMFELLAEVGVPELSVRGRSTLLQVLMDPSAPMDAVATHAAAEILSQDDDAAVLRTVDRVALTHTLCCLLQDPDCALEALLALSGLLRLDPEYAVQPGDVALLVQSLGSGEAETVTQAAKVLTMLATRGAAAGLEAAVPVATRQLQSRTTGKALVQLLGGCCATWNRSGAELRTALNQHLPSATQKASKLLGRDRAFGDAFGQMIQHAVRASVPLADSMAPHINAQAWSAHLLRMLRSNVSEREKEAVSTLFFVASSDACWRVLRPAWSAIVQATATLLPMQTEELSKGQIVRILLAAHDTGEAVSSAQQGLWTDPQVLSALLRGVAAVHDSELVVAQLLPLVAHAVKSAADDLEEAAVRTCAGVLHAPLASPRPTTRASACELLELLPVSLTADAERLLCAVLSSGSPRCVDVALRLARDARHQARLGARQLSDARVMGALYAAVAEGSESALELMLLVADLPGVDVEHALPSVAAALARGPRALGLLEQLISKPHALDDTSVGVYMPIINAIAPMTDSQAALDCLLLLCTNGPSRIRRAVAAASGLCESLLRPEKRANPLFRELLDTPEMARALVADSDALRFVQDDWAALCAVGELPEGARLLAADAELVSRVIVAAGSDARAAKLLGALLAQDADGALRRRVQDSQCVDTLVETAIASPQAVILSTIAELCADPQVVSAVAETRLVASVSSLLVSDDLELCAAASTLLAALAAGSDRASSEMQAADVGARASAMLDQPRYLQHSADSHAHLVGVLRLLAALASEVRARDQVAVHAVDLLGSVVWPVRAAAALLCRALLPSAAVKTRLAEVSHWAHLFAAKDEPDAEVLRAWLALLDVLDAFEPLRRVLVPKGESPGVRHALAAALASSENVAVVARILAAARSPLFGEEIGQWLLRLPVDHPAMPDLLRCPSLRTGDEAILERLAALVRGGVMAAVRAIKDRRTLIGLLPVLLEHVESSSEHVVPALVSLQSTPELAEALRGHVEPLWRRLKAEPGWEAGWDLLSAAPSCAQPFLRELLGMLERNPARVVQLASCLSSENEQAELPAPWFDLARSTPAAECGPLATVLSRHGGGSLPEDVLQVVESRWTDADLPPEVLKPAVALLARHGRGSAALMPLLDVDCFFVHEPGYSSDTEALLSCLLSSSADDELQVTPPLVALVASEVPEVREKTLRVLLERCSAEGGRGGLAHALQAGGRPDDCGLWAQVAAKFCLGAVELGANPAPILAAVASGSADAVRLVASLGPLEAAREAVVTLLGRVNVKSPPDLLEALAPLLPWAGCEKGALFIAEHGSRDAKAHALACLPESSESRAALVAALQEFPTEVSDRLLRLGAPEVPAADLPAVLAALLGAEGASPLRLFHELCSSRSGAAVLARDPQMVARVVDELTGRSDAEQRLLLVASLRRVLETFGKATNTVYDVMDRRRGFAALEQQLRAAADPAEARVVLRLITLLGASTHDDGDALATESLLQLLQDKLCSPASSAVELRHAALALEAIGRPLPGLLPRLAPLFSDIRVTDDTLAAILSLVVVLLRQGAPASRELVAPTLAFLDVQQWSVRQTACLIARGLFATQAMRSFVSGPEVVERLLGVFERDDPASEASGGDEEEEEEEEEEDALADEEEKEEDEDEDRPDFENDDLENKFSHVKVPETTLKPAPLLAWLETLELFLADSEQTRAHAARLLLESGSVEAIVSGCEFIKSPPHVRAAAAVVTYVAINAEVAAALSLYGLPALAATVNALSTGGTWEPETLSVVFDAIRRLMLLPSHRPAVEFVQTCVQSMSRLLRTENEQVLEAVLGALKKLMRHDYTSKTAATVLCTSNALARVAALQQSLSPDVAAAAMGVLALVSAEQPQQVAGELATVPGAYVSLLEVATAANPNSARYKSAWALIHAGCACAEAAAQLRMTCLATLAQLLSSDTMEHRRDSIAALRALSEADHGAYHRAVAKAVQGAGLAKLLETAAGTARLEKGVPLEVRVDSVLLLTSLCQSQQGHLMVQSQQTAAALLQLIDAPGALATKLRTATLRALRKLANHGETRQELLPFVNRLRQESAAGGEHTRMAFALAASLSKDPRAMAGLLNWLNHASSAELWVEKSSHAYYASILVYNLMGNVPDLHRHGKREQPPPPGLTDELVTKMYHCMQGTLFLPPQLPNKAKVLAFELNRAGALHLLVAFRLTNPEGCSDEMLQTMVDDQLVLLSSFKGRQPIHGVEPTSQIVEHSLLALQHLSFGAKMPEYMERSHLEALCATLSDLRENKCLGDEAAKCAAVIVSRAAQQCIHEHRSVKAFATREVVLAFTSSTAMEVLAVQTMMALSSSNDRVLCTAILQTRLGWLLRIVSRGRGQGNFDLTLAAARLVCALCAHVEARTVLECVQRADEYPSFVRCVMLTEYDFRSVLLAATELVVDPLVQHAQDGDPVVGYTALPLLLGGHRDGVCRLGDIAEQSAAEFDLKRVLDASLPLLTDLHSMREHMAVALTSGGFSSNRLRRFLQARCAPLMTAAMTAHSLAGIFFEVFVFCAGGGGGIVLPGAAAQLMLRGVDAGGKGAEKRARERSALVVAEAAERLCVLLAKTWEQPQERDARGLLEAGRRFAEAWRDVIEGEPAEPAARFVDDALRCVGAMVQRLPHSLGEDRARAVALLATLESHREFAVAAAQTIMGTADARLFSYVVRALEGRMSMVVAKKSSGQQQQQQQQQRQRPGRPRALTEDSPRTLLMATPRGDGLDAAAAAELELDAEEDFYWLPFGTFGFEPTYSSVCVLGARPLVGIGRPTATQLLYAAPDLWELLTRPLQRLTLYQVLSQIEHGRGGLEGLDEALQAARELRNPLSDAQLAQQALASERYGALMSALSLFSLPQLVSVAPAHATKLSLALGLMPVFACLVLMPIASALDGLFPVMPLLITVFVCYMLGLVALSVHRLGSYGVYVLPLPWTPSPSAAAAAAAALAVDLWGFVSVPLQAWGPEGLPAELLWRFDGEVQFRVALWASVALTAAGFARPALARVVLWGVLSGLVAALDCSYPSGSQAPFLEADETTECWAAGHVWEALLAMLSLAVCVPTAALAVDVHLPWSPLFGMVSTALKFVLVLLSRFLGPYPGAVVVVSMLSSAALGWLAHVHRPCADERGNRAVALTHAVAVWAGVAALVGLSSSPSSAWLVFGVGVGPVAMAAFYLSSRAAAPVHPSSRPAASGGARGEAGTGADEVHPEVKVCPSGPDLL